MFRKHSIKLLSWLGHFWVIMLIFILAINYPFRHAFTKIITEGKEKSIHNSIDIAESGIESMLQMADSFIYEALYDSSRRSSTQLYQALMEEQDPLELMCTRNTILSSLNSIVSWSEIIDFILLYTDREDGVYWMDAGESASYQQRREIKRTFEEYIQEEKADQIGRYMLIKTSRGNCMLRMLKMEGSYLIISVSENGLLDILNKACIDDKSIVFAVVPGEGLAFSSDRLDTSIHLEDEGCYVKVNGKQYLQTGQVSSMTGYYFGVLTEKESVLNDLWLPRMLFTLLFLALVIIMPLFLYILILNLVKPLEKMVSTMNEIAKGELELTVEENHKIAELAHLTGSFNHMIRRIEALKIEKYEAALTAQKASLQYLQLQIKPHFYVNLLNIIYSLAERQDFGMIQKIAHAVVCYSRYMFQDASELVEMHRELEHVSYYMEIQRIRYNTLIDWTVNIPENIRSAQVPPFVIQSFVENSIKYAYSANKTCHILIQAETDSEKEYLKIYIRDNGMGYSQDYLDRDWEQKGESGHIGLTNVRQRLQMIFGGKAEMRLYNDDGAVAEITLPYISVDDFELED